MIPRSLEDTSFWLGPVSKAVMGTAIAIAEERGFLTPDDEIQPLLTANDSINIENPMRVPITFRHLVTHTSGIDDDFSCPQAAPTTLDTYLAAYMDFDGQYHDPARNFSSNAPGEQAKYSNIGAARAGYSNESAALRPHQVFGFS